jgi:2-methylcitrate dehydratase PrpD
VTAIRRLAAASKKPEGNGNHVGLLATASGRFEDFWLSPGLRGMTAAPAGTLGQSTTAPIAELASFAAGLSWEDLPTEVRAHAADMLLDTLGVMMWGAQDSFLRDFRRKLLRGRPGQVTIYGTADRAEPGTAALFNAATTTVTQIDEGHRRALGHPGIHIIPAALAIAEREEKSGRDLITAIVAAYEVAVRIGRSMRPLKPGIHAHGHWAVIAAAVAGAKLLGGDAQVLGETIESAATLTLRPATRTVNDGATAHHLGVGLGTQNAVQIAYAAAAGMTGSPGTLIEYLGPDSAVTFRPELLLENMAPDVMRYEILDSYFKFQPMCAHVLTTIEAVDALRDRVPSADAVRSVRVRTYGLAADLGNARPPAALAAKFSIPFGVAARLTSTDRKLVSLHERDLGDPALIDLMARVKVVAEPELEALYPNARPSIVEVELADGTRLSERRDMPKGDAANPASAEELFAKFMELSSPVLGEERARRLGKMALSVDEVLNVADLAAGGAAHR